MQIVSGVTSGMLRVAKNPPAELSPEAKKRLRWMEYYQAHNRNISLTCRYFGISRPTFYRWLDRYDPKDLRSLENRKTIPKKRRKPTWTVEALLAVREKSSMPVGEKTSWSSC